MMWKQLSKNAVLNNFLSKNVISLILFIAILTACAAPTKPVDNNPQILNFSSKNDLAFLLNMDYKIAKNFWDEGSIEIAEHFSGGFTQFTVILSPGVYLDVGHDNKVRAVMVVYTKTAKADSASLLGLDGNDTIESIADKFGRENVYPYNQAARYGGEIEQEVTSDMCSITLYDHYFYRANFDENGVMTDAFVSGGV